MATESLLISVVLINSVALAYNKIPDCFMDVASGIRSKCQEETGVDLAVVDRMMDGEFSAEKSVSCYLGCILNSFGVYKPDGYIDYDRLLLGFSDDLKPAYKAMYDICKEYKGEDMCETALISNKCYYNYNKDIYFVL
ncbi:PREDICTED: general odorant-binding protein 72-like [Nicrophorus vespilloides]|uniref:General odorant-binding protein 72-like n=1 Tax=Nicrophorus vespilloides TaxID=110193 RepID=A0ABM1N445_NICVS|nr:PREDICTED: general odorant-binding protein 72-like [Nicrophorus vespilloides]